MTEVWLPVIGSDGWYEVSDLGRVRSWYNGRWGRRTDPKLLSISPNCISGYLDVLLTIDGRKTTRAVHRLVSEAFLGPRPDGLEVRHINGVKTDNRPGNLRYGTKKENAWDRTLHGTQQRGTDFPNSKLDYVKAKAIRYLYASDDFSYSDLALTFGVDDRTIRKVVSGEHWKEMERIPVQAV